MVVTCLFVVETRLAKRSAGGTCEKNKTALSDPDRIPNNVNNLTCHDRDECFSALASVIVFNKKDGNIETLNIVIACIKRVSCQHGQKDIVKKIVVDANTKLSYTVTSCKKTENEISAMLPRMKNGALVYEKVIYDCRCPCGGTR